MSTCSCPGKVMLAGEYAVVEGGPALLVAVSARAQASITDQEQALSPFLASVQNLLRRRYGETSEAALAAGRVTVDTSAFRHDSQKLGLGSSAAVTVAAIGAAMATQSDELDLDQIHKLAAQAHGEAQATMGAKGSGADVAACTYGGCLHFQRTASGVALRPIHLPTDLHLVFPWTGVPACTAPLVATIRQWCRSNPRLYEQHGAAISASAETLANTQSASKAIAAIGEGGRAIAALGHAAGVELWLPVHSRLAEAAEQHGGALKPTGAGAGDLALAAFSDEARAQAYQERLADLGIFCAKLVVDTEGVRLQA